MTYGEKRTEVNQRKKNNGEEDTEKNCDELFDCFYVYILQLQ